MLLKGPRGGAVSYERGTPVRYETGRDYIPDILMREEEHCTPSSMYRTVLNVFYVTLNVYSMYFMLGTRRGGTTFQTF